MSLAQFSVGWALLAAVLASAVVAGCVYTQRGRDPKLKRVVWAITVIAFGLLLAEAAVFVLTRAPAAVPLFSAVPLAVVYIRFAVCGSCGAMIRKATLLGKVPTCPKCGAPPPKPGQR